MKIDPRHPRCPDVYTVKKYSDSTSIIMHGSPKRIRFTTPLTPSDAVVMEKLLWRSEDGKESLWGPLN